ncbi:DUF1304 domain-containing protein [Arthrobacter sp. NIO-1057]|uniref:DUF1304 domain-containing protein n=1 Tax=Arthrobacter sp. NIO-1057 TaxID=993071 RepID=UPI00071D2D06|nr:DUF1304 domain-containing protein [Arthrobacter sp. NIO-1057]KSU67814.1 hypothetical protein AS038_01565 [Arthrobacter sp. NIO-1057]SCB79946.1 putative membrane protein [Arthrobacter sp. NIO-1057]
MIITALILAGLAALLHVYIFFMESLLWTTPKVRATFGSSEAEAEATKEMAFNQGFYNLFLAIAAFAGIIFHIAGQPVIGATLIFAGAGSMLLAALVLITSSPSKAGAAIKQGVFPLLAVIALIIGMTL